MQLSHLLATTLLCLCEVQASDRPVIGVLAQETMNYDGYNSYIAASYVKAVEQAGARVLPVFINQTEEYYSELLNMINGVVFPGGGLNFTNLGGYGDAARIILNYAKQFNYGRDHFPVLGICLGFEVFFYLEIESYDILTYCNVKNLALPLKSKHSREGYWRTSQLYHGVANQITKILQTQPVTYNEHKRCVTNQKLEHYCLKDNWRVLSTSRDKYGDEFISSAESWHYPIAGVQFHPEKPAYEWSLEQAVPHSEDAIMANRIFFDWLVREARLSTHVFQYHQPLIYNYSATYVNGYYQQVYLFP